MNDLLVAAYERLILRRPWLVLGLVAAVVAGANGQLLHRAAAGQQPEGSSRMWAPTGRNAR